MALCSDWAKMKCSFCVLLIGWAIALVQSLATPANNLYSRSQEISAWRTCGEDYVAETNSPPIRRTDVVLVPRRNFLSAIAASGVATTALFLATPAFAAAKDLKEEYRQGTAALSDDDTTAPVPREAYQKLASGVVYADLRPGSGEPAKEGFRANLQWVLRKSNGYFVDSSQVNESVPFIFTIGDGTAIAGLDEAVRGMKVGGVRRILIPPALAYVQGLEDGKPGPVPTGFGPRQQMRRVQGVRKDVPGEYVYLEVQLTRLRQ